MPTIRNEWHGVGTQRRAAKYVTIEETCEVGFAMEEVSKGSVGARKCPVCGSTIVRRSQMIGFFERSMLRIIGLRAFRCEDCDHRFFSFKSDDDKISKIIVHDDE